MSHSKHACWAAFVLAAIVSTFPCSQAHASITVISEWRMGESDGGAVPAATVQTSQDCIGTNHLQFQGATYSSDVGNRTFPRLASTLSINFTNNGCATNNHVVSTLTDNFGIEAWVEPTGAANGLIAYNGNTGTSGWGLGIGSSNYTGLFGGVDSFNGRFILLNSWSHVALVRSNGVAILFVNGAPTATNTSTPHIPAGNFGLACAPQVPGQQTFTGFMDEVRVFTFAPGQFSTADLLYNALPASPSTLPARKITATHATLNGFCNPGGVATGGWFEWGIGTGYGNSTPPLALGNGATPLTVTNDIDGLQPGTAYHFRIVTTNSAGIFRSWDQTFVTPALNIATNQTTYVRVPFTNSPTLSATPLALSISDGANGMILKADGTISLWGDNTYGQTNFANTLSNIIGIAAGDYHFVALKRDGTVVSWGKNNNGQTNVPAGLDNVVSVAAGGDISAAIRRDGTIASWGYGLPLAPPLTNIVQLSASLYNAAALTAEGKILTGGTPPPDATNLVAAAAGAYHYVALRADGKVFAWGDNSSGQTNIPPAATNVIAIAATGNGSMALRQDGIVFAWGSNDGNKNTVPPAVTNVIAIGAAGGANFALRVDGVAFGWGSSLGNQTSVPGGLTNITGVVTVNGSVNTNAPGLNTLIYTTTNLFSAMNAATVSVSVLSPSLTLMPSNLNTLTLSWPSNALGYTLEQSTNLSGVWSAASGVTNPISISATNARVFYRLAHP